MGCGSSDAGSYERQQQQQQQAAIQQGVGQVNAAFSGFTPQFYQGVQNAYTNYETPQLYQQYQPMNQQLGYKLANQGLLGSGADQFLHGQLAQQMGQAQQQIGNQALGASRGLQQQVGQEKGNLISQLQTASDPSSIAQQAVGQAGQLSAPSTFQPIGQMLQNFATMYLGQQNANTYNQFANQYLSAFNNPGVYAGAIPQPSGG
jgi:hypothetical protein